MDALAEHFTGTPASAEELLVIDWRLDQFGRLGFPTLAAVTLAASPADLAEARKLVAAGCPADTAARILL
jgi:hypothetical protein